MLEKLSAWFKKDMNSNTLLSAETARKEKAMTDAARLGDLGQNLAGSLNSSGMVEQTARDTVANIMRDQVLATLTSMVVSSGVDEHKRQQAKASLIRALISEEGLNERVARETVTRLKGMDEQTARETIGQLIGRS